MCIRDRIYLAGAKLLAHHPVSVVTDGIGLNITVIGYLGQLCLLYTSDAADERSSVDLGGRRIIKKKNHDNHAGWL